MSSDTNPMLDPGTANRIRSEIENNPIVLYMNGTPIFPQCSASAQASQLLDLLGIPYKSIDVAQDPTIREGMRKYSHWPTFPQIYIASTFVGGVDILREMYETGELQKIADELTSTQESEK